MVRVMTASALQRTSSNMSSQQTSLNDPKSEPSAEAKTAGTLTGHEEPPATLEPFRKPIEQPVTRSAPHHSGSTNSGPFRAESENGTLNGVAARVKPAAIPSGKLPTAQKPDGLSETESLAELIVRSVTTAALKRSGSSNSSLIRVYPDNTLLDCTVSDVPVIEEGAGAEPLDAEETVHTPKQGVLPEKKETFAELIVRSVTTSALQHSTSSLLKADTGNGLSLGNDSFRRKLGSKGAGHAAKIFAASGVPQVKVVEMVERKVETQRCTTATERPKPSTEGAAQVLGKAEKTAQAQNATNGPRNYDEDPFGDAARHVNGGGEAESGRELFVAKVGDKADLAFGGYRSAGSNFGRRNGGNDEAGDKVAIGTPYTKQHGGEGDGSKEDYVHEYSSDTFEKEGDAEKRSGSRSSLTSSSSDNHNGNQRRQVRPPQPVRAFLSARIAAASPSSDGLAAPEVASTEPHALTLPKPRRLENPENNRARNTNSGDARSAEITGGFKSPGVALRSSEYISGRSACTGGAGTGKDEPGSVDTSSASQGGHATLSRITSPSAAVTARGSIGGRSGSSTKPMLSGAVVGFAALHRDLSAWFSGEVLAPSTATAISVLGNKGREPSSNAFSSISQPAGDSGGLAVVQSWNDGTTTTHSGVSVTTPVVHNQRESGAGNEGVPRLAFSESQPIEKHPARLFHLLWQRDRQVWAILICLPFRGEDTQII